MASVRISLVDAVALLELLLRDRDSKWALSLERQGQERRRKVRAILRAYDGAWTDGGQPDIICDLFVRGIDMVPDSASDWKMGVLLEHDDQLDTERPVICINDYAFDGGVNLRACLDALHIEYR